MQNPGSSSQHLINWVPWHMLAIQALWRWRQEDLKVPLKLIMLEVNLRCAVMRLCQKTGLYQWVRAHVALAEDQEDLISRTHMVAHNYL